MIEGLRLLDRSQQDQAIRKCTSSVVVWTKGKVLKVSRIEFSCCPASDVAMDTLQGSPWRDVKEIVHQLSHARLDCGIREADNESNPIGIVIDITRDGGNLQQDMRLEAREASGNTYMSAE